MSLESLFPPFGLSISVDAVEMRLLRDSDLDAYVDLITADVFADPDADHVFDWWRLAQDAGPLESLRYLWRIRGGLAPDDWRLQLGVWEGGRLVGVQDVRAADFSVTRTVSTGSFLRLDAAGRGLGTLMRQAVLVFAFDHLGAVRAESAALPGNGSSLRVSDKVGYRSNGTRVAARNGHRIEEVQVVVTPDTLVRPDADVRVAGVTRELLAMLGASPKSSTS